MCIDYRFLNDCSTGGSWPIPNIKGIFERLGKHKSSRYGVVDLTAGYHQAPVAMNSRIFLAFICFMGIFEWTRLPFGPKKAPPYFQEIISTVVLIGLLYFICELYLDDIIIHADSDIEFVNRLRTVFERFDKHNIKCKAG